MLDIGLLGRIGQGLPNGNLIAPCEGIDEGSVGASKQTCYKVLIGKGAFVESDIVEGFKLLSDEERPLADMSSDLIAHGRTNAGDGSCLSASSVDYC